VDEIVEAITAVPPERVPAVFLYGLSRLAIGEDGLAPGHSVELVDVVAVLAALVREGMRDEATVQQMCLRRLAVAALGLLATAFTCSAHDREIVETFWQALAEWRAVA
jgi:hypothetical protein